MAPNFVFNGPTERTQQRPTLHITSVPIVTVGEHNCEANRLVIQISATNLTPESFVDTFILEKASQLNLYPNQIFRDLLLTMQDQFIYTPYSIPSKNKITAGFNRNEFDRSSYVSSIKSYSKKTNLFFVINQAIGYIQSLTTVEDTPNQFWAYFNRTWMVRFAPCLWNISAGMMNRINNALERYNRRLNDFFANTHPNICSFVEIIKEEFLYFEERYAEIRLNSYSVVFRPIIRYEEALLEEFNIYLLNN
ncbi:LOW QUALITY PROTEIN: hypothetical protein HZS_7897 [Henneguya salminicola]|nr:LOW QUALITY PROTEIN: hypothetical protein HZS_7897 [Henneguya salminicola]